MVITTHLGLALIECLLGLFLYRKSQGFPAIPVARSAAYGAFVRAAGTIVVSINASFAARTPSEILVHHVTGVLLWGTIIHGVLMALRPLLHRSRCVELAVGVLLLLNVVLIERNAWGLPILTVMIATYGYGATLLKRATPNPTSAHAEPRPRTAPKIAGEKLESTTNGPDQLQVTLPSPSVHLAQVLPEESVTSRRDTVTPRFWSPVRGSDDRFISYTFLKGKLLHERASDLRRLCMSRPDWIWSEQEIGPPRPEFVRLRYWENDAPVEVSISASGAFKILAPVDSRVLQWMNSLEQREVKIDDQAVVNSLIALCYANTFYTNELDHLARFMIFGIYGDADRKALRAIPARSKTIYAWLAAHLPERWAPLPNGSENTASYRRAFLQLMALLPQDFSHMDERWVHSFIQVRSEWGNESITYPTTPERVQITELTPWDRIIRTAQRRFLAQSERENIYQKLLLELAPPTLLVELASYGRIGERKAHRKLMESIPLEILAEWQELLRPIGISVPESLRSAISRLLLRTTEQDQSGVPCDFCGDDIGKIIIPSEIAEALRGHKPAFCAFCLSEVFYHDERPWLPDRPLRPLPPSKQDLIILLQELAKTSGVLPEPDSIRFIAKVPRERIDKTLRLLWRLPDANRRKQITSDGWLSLMAQAGLLDESGSRRLGVRCVANDGHACRSLAEKFIDDWLFANGIIHTPEPLYPVDMELNPNHMRADFMIADTFVEYFGLMDREEYAEKAARKRVLAKRHGIHLIEFYPEDLTDEGLREKLSGFMVPKGRTN